MERLGGCSNGTLDQVWSCWTSWNWRDWDREAVAEKSERARNVEDSWLLSRGRIDFIEGYKCPKLDGKA